ncbi:MAG: TIGR04551 family protein, partial [Polyangiaceae bacterium]
GMIENSGDGIDSDYQTTLDRLMFVTGIKSMDLYFGGAWDFVSTGTTTATPYNVYGGQPYNDCNLCNVNEWAAFVAHRTNPAMQKLSLARGDLVVNGGLYTKFRSQSIDVASGQTPLTVDSTASTTSPTNNGLETRQAWALTPDLWLQTLWRKFRFEAEASFVYGELGYLAPQVDPNNPLDIRQWGLVTQTEYRALEDKLDLQFGFGWASGDPWSYNTANGQNQGALNPGPATPQEYQGSPYMSTFRFHPDYRVDLIFFRSILSRVEGAYYFRPSVDYDFLHHANGEKFGGGAAVIWSRASEFEQTPGHSRDLGVELDVQVYYQSKDGSLNDDPSKIGGFFAMAQYGIFFPLGGLNYLPGQTTLADSSLATAQAARLFLGIAF